MKFSRHEIFALWNFHEKFKIHQALSTLISCISFIISFLLKNVAEARIQCEIEIFAKMTKRKKFRMLKE